MKKGSEAKDSGLGIMTFSAFCQSEYGQCGPKDQEGRFLVQWVRQTQLEQPFNLNQPTNFNQKPELRGEREVSVQVDKLLGQLNEGFFIEAGAYDGEYKSNTLFFEVNRGWTGLLIEPNRRQYQQLRSKNRKVTTANCALALSRQPKRIAFVNQEQGSGIQGSMQCRYCTVIILHPDEGRTGQSYP